MIFFNKIMRFFKNIREQKPISFLDIILFFRQLSFLLNSGIPLLRTLLILEKNQIIPSFQSIILSLRNEIALGNRFSESLRKYPAYFDELTCHLVYAGEYAGTLESMLSHIVFLKERNRTFKNKIKRA